MAIRNAVVQVFQYETLYELVEVAGLNGGKSLAAIAAGQHPRWGDMGNDNLRREAIDPEWPGANSSARSDPANHRAEKRTPVHAPEHSTSFLVSILLLRTTAQRQIAGGAHALRKFDFANCAPWNKFAAAIVAGVCPKTEILTMFLVPTIVEGWLDQIFPPFFGHLKFDYAGSQGG